MNQQLSKLITKLRPATIFVKRYLTFIIVILFLSIYGFLTYKINTFSGREPSDAEVTNVLKTIPRPKVDKATVDKIQQLQDQHVEVKSLFDQARSNPFSE
ncbi:MAG: hypothetical protein NVS1B7_0120 [Candidatus Saccharimonadales bacterium]